MALSIVYVQIPVPVFISEANNEAIKCLSLGEKKIVNSESQKRFPISAADGSSRAGCDVRAFFLRLSTPPLWGFSPRSEM